MQFNQAPAPRESSLGDAYDPTASYSVDDLCIHDNVLYKCTTAIPEGGEAWNSAHWTETNIADEISALNSNIPDIQMGVTEYTGLKQGGFAGRVTVTVTLPHAMPNADYFAHAELNGAHADFPLITCYVFTKTTTTFDVILINSASGSVVSSGYFKWIAVAKS